MPRIQEYRQQVRTPGAVDFQRARGVSIGGGLQSLGQSINNMEQMIDRKLQQDGEYNASIKASQAALDVDKNLKIKADKYDAAKYRDKTLNPEGKTFTQEFAEDFDSMEASLLEGATNNYERNALQSRMLNIKTKMLSQAQDFEDRAETKYDIDTFKTNTNTFANNVRANPNALKDAMALAQDNIATMPRISEQMKRELSTQTTNVLYDSALDGKVTALETKPNVSPREIQGLINELKKEGNEWQTNSSAPKFDNALTRLQKLGELTTQRNKSEFNFAFKQEMEFMSNEGVDRGKFTKETIMNAGFAPKETERMLRELEYSQAIAKEVTAIKDLPTNEIAAMLSPEALDKEMKSDPDNYFLIQRKVSARMQAWNKRQKQYEADPARYAEKASPALNTKGEALRLALQNDPTLSSQETIARAEDYATAQITEQQRLAPNEVPSILDSSIISEVQFKISSVPNTSQGAEQALKVLQDQSTLWGRYSDVAFKDLRRAKAISGEHYVAAQLSKDPKNRQLAMDIVKSTVKPAEKRDPAVFNDFKAEANDALTDLKKSLGVHTVDADGVLKDYSDTIANLMYYYNEAGLNKGSAKALADQIILNKYEFKDEMRIPKQFDASLVSSSANASIAALGKAENLYVPPDAPSKEDYVNKIKGYGKWVNYGDEGLMLVDGNTGNAIGQLDEKGNRVPIVKSFSELEQEEFERRADFYLKSSRLSRQGIENLPELSEEQKKAKEVESLKMEEQRRREKIKSGPKEVRGNTW